jgi:autotransporter-associated beta strand protein
MGIKALSAKSYTQVTVGRRAAETIGESNHSKTMKTTQMHVSSRNRLLPLSRQLLLLAAAASMTGGAVTVGAQTAPIDKANSYTSLATGTDWVGGAVPGTNNIAIWNAGSGTPVPEPLGGSLTWAGIQILSPGGPVTITPDGNTLTNGEVGIVGLAGIDMSAASVNLSLSNNIVANGVQNWNLGPGETLALGGTLSAISGAAVRFHLGAGSNVTITNAPNTLLGPTNGGIAGDIFGTVNDVDFAGVNSSQQIVPGANLGIYTPNASGNPPSMSGTINGVIDCTNAGTLLATYGGVRLSSTLTIWGLRFNETNALFGNWQVNIPSTRNLTLNDVLITTNVGNNPVTIVQGSVGSADVVTIGGTVGNLLLFQNNPGAPLFIQPGLTIRQGSASGTACGIVKMGAGAVNIQCNSTYTGGTKIYEGTVQIDGLGNLGAGALNVYGGAFAQSSGSTNYAPTTISTGATNTVLAVTANSQSFDNSTLTFNAGSALEFIYSNTVPSVTAPTLVVSNINGLTLTSPVSVEVLCGGLSTGTFPLLSYAGTIGGAGYSALSSLTLPPHILGYLSNDVTHSYIDLVVTNVDQPIVWNAPSGVWDVGLTANWLDALGNTTTYQQVGPLGDNVLFNDSAPGSPITVTLNSVVTPSSVTVNNANDTYTISGTGNISGSDSFNKTGSGTVTLATVNSFTGGMDINGGTVVFNTLPNLGAGGIIFGGGTLEYNGNSDDISTRTVALNAGGGTINTAGSSVNYANPIGNNGAGGLTKSGAGTLTLNGTNTFGGNTTINQGTLALGANTFLTNSAAIVVNSGAVLDTAVSGVNLVLSTHSSQILAGNGQINGIVTVPSQTTVSPGTNGAAGTLSINGGYTISGGTNFIDVAATSNDLITVSGNLTLTGGFVQVNLIGTVPNGRYVVMTYSGSLTGSGANMTPLYATGNQIASIDTSVHGQVAVLITAAAHDALTWPGTGNSWDELGTADWLNGGTSWAFTNGDTVTFNDSQTGGNTTVELMSNVQPTLVIVSNTVVPIYTFADGTGDGGGAIDGNGSLIKDGTGTLVMATANSYRGTTTIKNGTLQLGSGGIGDIGTGNVTNNGALVFQEGDGAIHGVAGAVSGTGSLTENASATVVLEANNTYTGPTTISAGTLQVGNGAATGNLGSTPVVTNNSVLAIDLSGSSSFPYNVIGSGALEVAGPGTVSLAGSSLNYQGNTYISNGVVKLAASNELPSTNTVAGSTGDLNLDGGIASAGVLDLGGFNLTLNALSGQANNVNGIITNSSTSTTTTNTLTLLQTVATTYNGQIMDHGTTGAKTKVVVTGPGVLTLNPTTNYLTGVQNSSTFSGGLVISNGSVVLGTPGLSTAININESILAPGTGPITLLGTNASLSVEGATGSTVPTYAALTNTIIVPAGQTATVFGTQRGNINSTLLGSGVLNLVTIYVRPGVLGNWSAFSGQLVLSATTAANGNIGFGLTNGLPNTELIITTNVDMYCGTYNQQSPYTFPAAGIFPIGALSGGDLSSVLESTNSGAAGGVQATFEIGGLNQNTTYAGGIIDNNNLLKVGTGTLTLDCGGVLGTNTIVDPTTGFDVTEIGYGTNNVVYSGTTTVSNGVLALAVPVVLTNSSTVTLASPTAELDASEMGYISNLTVTLDNGSTQELVIDSTFEVVASHTLGGIGTLNGLVQADQGSILSVGLPTGTFNVTSNASLSGSVLMNLNDTNAAASSLLAAPSFTINSTATLVVTNAGPGLTNGVSFTLFSKPVSGFASVTLPATDPTGTTNYVWQNNLAVNGSITLTNGGLVIPTAPPPIKFSLSGTTLTLSWPSAYLGYILQAQTNSVKVGLSNNWVNVSGSGSGTSVNITINPANGTVFYRLIQ